MPATINYNRPSATLVAVAPMVHNILATETLVSGADVLVAIEAVGVLGDTGVARLEYQVDADEGGGADVQTMYKILLTPSISADGKHTLTAVITPVAGAGGDLTPTTTAVTHPEKVDAWQSAAGNPRL